MTGRQTTRVAAFDCGTNSLRLLVADIDVEAGTSVDLVREMRVVRLGQGVDRSGRIAEASLKRVFAAVEQYMELVREHEVKQIGFCATSAARDAENAADFLAGVKDRTGVDPRVIDGDEEAAPTLPRGWPCRAPTTTARWCSRAPTTSHTSRSATSA